MNAALSHSGSQSRQCSGLGEFCQSAADVVVMFGSFGVFTNAFLCFCHNLPVYHSLYDAQQELPCCAEKDYRLIVGWDCSSDLSG